MINNTVNPQLKNNQVANFQTELTLNTYRYEQIAEVADIFTLSF